jgi:hypothetical protein
MKPPPTKAGPPTPAAAPAPVKAPSGADSSAELAAIRPNRTPLIVGALVVVVVLLVVAIVAVGRGPEETGTKPVVATKPDAPPPPAKTDVPPKVDEPKVVPPAAIVKLTLEAMPPQAEVYEDDILLGATPLTLSRPPGTLTSLRLEAKGFQPLSRKVRFESDTTLRLELEKEVAKVKTGGGAKKPRPPGDDDLMDLPE